MNDSVKKKIVAVVPAAGIGSRMNINIPKQYIKLGKLTVIEYTLTKLLMVSVIDKIIVAIHPDDDIFHTLSIAQHEKIQVTFGGENRSDSVLSGLMLLEGDEWVLVHDAARPCVMQEDILKLVDCVSATQQGAILATKITDTIKKVSSQHPCQIENTYDRNLLWAAATPQMFNVEKLRMNLSDAITQGLTITDEASAMEFAGEYPLLVECQRDNIKVTREEDLALATFYLQIQGFFQA